MGFEAILRYGIYKRWRLRLVATVLFAEQAVPVGELYLTYSLLFAGENGWHSRKSL